MIVVSILPQAEFGPNDHQVDAFYFIFPTFTFENAYISSFYDIFYDFVEIQNFLFLDLDVKCILDAQIVSEIFSISFRLFASYTL